MPIHKSVTLNTGAVMPTIGLGTWKSAPGEVEKAVEFALKEGGYRHIDTAYDYRNESEVGQGIKASGVPREEIFLTTKLPNSQHGTVQNALNESLAKLDAGYIDLWLMHWPLSFVSSPARGGDTTQSAKDQNGKVMQDETPILETWKAMEEMHKNGKARAIGVSNFTLPLLEQLLSMCEIPPAVLQIELHPYLQQNELIEYCQTKGIHVTAYSPLGSQAQDDVNILEDPVLQEIAKNHKKTVGQVILQWDLQRHISVIPKASSPEHMKENLQIFDFELTSDEIRKIEGLDRGLRFLSALKIWGIPLFPEETGEVSAEQAVGDMFAGVETQSK